MPNWCSNYISISGSEADIAAIKERVKDGLTFSSLMPMPKQLEGIVSGSTTVDGKQIHGYRVYKKNEDGTKELVTDDHWGVKDDPEIVPVSDEEKIELLSKYEATDWYEWNVANWGTKWDVSPVTLEETKSVDTVTLSGNFDTAWSPPIKWLVAASLTYPTLTFKLAFAEGGVCYYGVFEVKNGEVIEEWDKNNFWRSDEEDEAEGDDEVEVEEGDEEVDDEDEDEDSYGTRLTHVTDECKEHLESYGLHTGG